MDNNILIHHGIKGQRWGVRRFQNEDGTRTAAGLKRYSSGDFVPRETKIPNGALQERPQVFKPKSAQESVEASKRIGDKIAEKRKEHAVKKAMDTAKSNQKYWEDSAKRTEKYIKMIENGEADDDFSSARDKKENLKIEKAELKKMQQHAKSWLDTQDYLKNMKISDMSVSEVKKKTSKSAMISTHSGTK